MCECFLDGNMFQYLEAAPSFAYVSAFKIAHARQYPTIKLSRMRHHLGSFLAVAFGPGACDAQCNHLVGGARESCEAYINEPL